ncbi:hypothetical protein [Achromobacter xylosoxidans]|uniref:hypothetical protein n=1 Tax=Alcaligenes xylosoxydans xylosoxydans TaxID=85698 RepID=UPI0006C1109E|nr:hypothetical protein [Achromobacter xylosoxidans]CUI26467.1 Uncharacterised protein [Achromobacter xylosoxidans]
MNEQNNIAPPAIVVTLTRTLGAYGAAFDLPGPHRAFTYRHQPGNIGAHRLGAAWQKAASGSSGDLIDRGLGLLKALQEVGFGVFVVSENAAPADEQNVLCCDAAMDFRRSGAAFPAHPLPVFSAGKWTYDGTGQSFDYKAMDEAAFSVYRAALASAPVPGEAKNYPGDNVAERLDKMADGQPPGSQAQSDLYAAATIWRKHIAHRAAPQASAENVRNAALEEAAKLMDQTLRSNGAALIRGLKRSQAHKDGGRQRAGDAALARLAEPHTGMRVDYQGLLRQAREGLHNSPGLAEMLRQLQGHLRELGQRWYAGDTAVVDELLQLYCVESNARAALSATQAEQGELDA